MDTACRNLELPFIHHHSLRHYFATCAIESGVAVMPNRVNVTTRNGGSYYKIFRAT
jgi:hypothetical protein